MNLSFSAYFFLFIQQLIVASSSIWLTQFILGISKETVNLNWLWLYLLFLILPYIPGALTLIEVSKTQIKNCIEYVQKFSEIHSGKILKWLNDKQRSSTTAILSGEACPTINSYIRYLYQLSSSAINVLMNLLVLAFLIDIYLLLMYFLGIVLASIILYFQKQHKTNLTLKAQDSRIGWTSLLVKAWDNILLNNNYNSAIWHRNNNNQNIKLVTHTVELEKFNQIIAILMAFVLILPSMILISYLAVMNVENISFLAIITVLFPRLFQVLNISYELLFLVADYPVQKAKMKTVLSIADDKLQSNENSNLLQDRIHWDKIQATLFSQEIKSKELLSNLPQSGRITLKGQNGTGKSSLLLLLKEKYKDQAYYLPSKHDLLFDVERDSLSTGQFASTVLKEINEKVEAPIILLDEWNANLDQKNRLEISQLIDKLSLKHCVVEVVHT